VKEKGRNSWGAGPTTSVLNIYNPALC